MKSAPAIAFDFLPSRWLRGALLAMVGLACASISFSAAPLGLRGALLVLVVAAGARAFLTLSQPSWRRIAWHADGSWTLGDRDGNQVLAKLTKHSRRGALLILRLQPETGACFEVVLLPDNLDRETFRRLCVRLLRGAAAAPA